MAEIRSHLIVRVRDAANQAAWEKFERLYRPVIFRIARAKGMQHSDALDLAQQVLMSVAAAIGRYEKQHEGLRFRNWLSRVTRNSILKALSSRPRDPAAGGTDVQDETWLAFEATVLQEVPIEAAAKRWQAR